MVTTNRSDGSVYVNYITTWHASLSSLNSWRYLSAAHKLKGLFLTFCADKLAKLLESIERQISNRLDSVDIYPLRTPDFDIGIFLQVFVMHFHPASKIL